MDEEVIGVGSACVFVLRGIWCMGLGVSAIMMAFAAASVPVGENYYLVDAEDGEGAGDVAGEGGA
jgi:hypothetical protein